MQGTSVKVIFSVLRMGNLLRVYLAEDKKLFYNSGLFYKSKIHF
ncbi:MAG: hypothetical protein OFPII_22010 [Osedax symbiont Rs1]|nr:MAG: hypothetical protein OFPII_22010 [Osedax symbiont Rs1]